MWLVTSLYIRVTVLEAIHSGHCQMVPSQGLMSTCPCVSSAGVASGRWHSCAVVKSLSKPVMKVG